MHDDVKMRNTHLRRTFTIQERVACALWRLATGDSYRSCGLQLGMGKSTAISVTKGVIKTIRKRRKDFIKFPIGPADIQKNIDDSQCLTKFPNVVGAVDDCHIEIRAPRDNAVEITITDSSFKVLSTPIRNSFI